MYQNLIMFRGFRRHPALILRLALVLNPQLEIHTPQPETSIQRPETRLMTINVCLVTFCVTRFSSDMN